MYVPETHDRFDAARLALLAYAGAPSRYEITFVEVPVPLDPDEEVNALLSLDKAGAIDAVLDCDWMGNRRWRVRGVTPAGREVARLLKDDVVWSRLKTDLARMGDPFTLLVAGYKDNITVAGG